MVLSLNFYRFKIKSLSVFVFTRNLSIPMKQRIISILNNFGVESTAITDDAHFIKDLGFDSLDLVDMMMQLEQEFSIAIPDEDYTRITSINSLMNYLQEQQSVVV